MDFNTLWAIIVNALFKESSDGEEYKAQVSQLTTQVEDLKKQLAAKDVVLGTKQAEIDSILTTVSATVERLNQKNPTPVTDSIIEELNASPSTPTQELPPTVNTSEVTPVEVTETVLAVVPDAINL